ncbi:MAG: hypothetical protein KC492_05055, partial [Myxococcales bacterium]|nr:hypothetical protein [Myxococcales bacterium]
MTFKHLVGLVVAAGCALVGCSEGEASRREVDLGANAALGSVEHSSIEVDLSSVMEHARLGFRRGVDGFQGGGAAYEVTVDSQRVWLKPARGG